MNLKKIKRMFLESENSGNNKFSDTLCTMFMFKGVDYPDVMHVTHKYFGDEYKDEEEIIKQLEDYFLENEFKEFKIPFDKIEHFGKEKNIKVLTPDKRYFDYFHPALKQQFDELRPDDYPEYKPHVTVTDNVDRVEIPVCRLVLTKGEDVIWSTDGFHLE